MAEYDLIVKALSERYMNQLASFVRGVDVTVERIEDKEAVAVQRTSDALYKVNEDGYEYLMLVEFQTRPDKKMARRLLEYTAMHHRFHEMPVYPVIINLTGSRQERKYTVDCLELTVVDFNYRQLNLQDIPGRELLYCGPVGLLPLAPLMRQDDSPEVVLEKCAKRLENEISEVDEQSTLYLALGVMAALKFPKNLIQKVLEVGRMENSPLFEGIREEWEAKGEAKGKAEGMAEIFFDMLEAKFGKVPDELRARLNASKNQEDIKQAMRKAVTSDTLEEYMAKLQH